jgi:hypothetical protein
MASFHLMAAFDEYIYSQLNRWKTGIQHTEYNHQSIKFTENKNNKEINDEKINDEEINDEEIIKEVEIIKEPPPYGICDYEEQFYKKYPKFSGYDWRWHKWGDYIGDYDLSGIEYLYEANGKNGRPLIDIQYFFKIKN